MVATMNTTIKISLRAMCIAALFLAPLAQAETATLQHDNNGNVTQRSITIGNTTQTTTYQYDGMNRMTGESGPAKTQTITYDENGNRKTDGAGSYVYETTSNRMSTRLGLAVSQDAVGNLTADGTGRTFSYNEANQLYQVFQGGVLLATYEYDANGLRLSKTTTASAPQGAQTVVYIHDQWGHILEEFIGTGMLIRSYMWRDDTPVAQIEHTSGGDKILYFEVDQLNTPRAAMDEAGKVVWRWESDAFGTTLPNEDPDGDGVKVTVNLRFSGYYADVESGLFYAKFRYYSPPLKIFTQPDRLDVVRQTVNPMYAKYNQPMNLMAALNQPFNYVGNNPLRWEDPHGLAVQICSKIWHPHTFICADGDCSGKYSSGGPFWAPGVIQDDSPNKSSASCSDVPAGKCDGKVFQQCVEKRIRRRGSSGDNYDWLAANCGQWVEEVIIQCRNECEKK